MNDQKFIRKIAEIKKAAEFTGKPYLTALQRLENCTADLQELIDELLGVKEQTTLA